MNISVSEREGMVNREAVYDLNYRIFETISRMDRDNHELTVSHRFFFDRLWLSKQ